MFMAHYFYFILFGERKLMAGRDLNLLLAGAVEVNILAQGPLRQITECDGRLVTQRLG